MQGGVKPCEWEFRITDLLQAGANTLQLYSLMAAPAALDVELGQLEVRVKTPPPPPPPKRPAPTGPLSVYEPRQWPKSCCSALKAGPGAISLAVSGETFAIESRFSTPDGKWVSGANAFFAYSRRIEPQSRGLLVRDNVHQPHEREPPADAAATPVICAGAGGSSGARGSRRPPTNS